MSHFIIGKTDFGIDEEKSRLVQTPAQGGVFLLDLEVHGNKATFDRILSQENSPWSWALYPPQFYLRQYPVPAQGQQHITLKLRPDDADRYDVALYMMEHNDVFSVVVNVADNTVTVSGKVDLTGKRVPFRIEWVKA